MTKRIKISVQISEATRLRMDSYLRRTGVKKGQLIEQALLHYLQAVDALPAEFVVHPRLVISRQTGEALLRDADVAIPSMPLRKLMQ